MKLDEAFNLGLQHHRAGKLREAEQIYRQILAQYPDQPDALHLLGIIAHEAGKYPAAAELIGRAVALSPARPDFHGSLGLALGAAGKLEEAVAEYRRAIELKPDLAQAHNNLGLALAATGRIDDAIGSFQQAARVAPQLADPPYNLANTLKDFGRLDEAIAEYGRAIALQPSWAQAHNNLGVALKLKGERVLAAEAFSRAAALAPNDAMAWNNLGEAQCELRQFEQAIASCRRALALAPNLPEAHNNLGFALWGLGRYDEAIQCFRVAIAVRPEYADAYGNLGNAYHSKGELAQAMCMFDTALALKPDHASVHWNKGYVHLLRGEYGKGWPGYEWRWRIPELGLRRLVCPQPQWDGGELNGRRILIYMEGGFGDSIHFVRYLPLVAERGGRIVLSCQTELLELMRIQSSVPECVDLGDANPPPFDVQTALPSLPGIFATTLETIPASVPYLKADPDRAARWEARVAEAAAGKKSVGLVWAGRSHPDPFRSTTLADLAAIGQVSEHCLFSLQKGDGAAQKPPPGIHLIDWTNELHDFADTAALIASLDLVITIDTSVAHLAGAMGKPTWVLLRHVPDWRWMLQGSECLWYPTMRLFRQPRLGDWKTPVAQIAAALAAR